MSVDAIPLICPMAWPSTEIGDLSRGRRWVVEHIGVDSFNRATVESIGDDDVMLDDASENVMPPIAAPRASRVLREH